MLATTQLPPQCSWSCSSWKQLNSECSLSPCHLLGNFTYFQVSKEINQASDRRAHLSLWAVWLQKEIRATNNQPRQTACGLIATKAQIVLPQPPNTLARGYPLPLATWPAPKPLLVFMGWSNAEFHPKMDPREAAGTLLKQSPAV